MNLEVVYNRTLVPCERSPGRLLDANEIHLFVRFDLVVNDIVGHASRYNPSFDAD